ncbi:MAG: hypothetical protein M3Q49_21025 [Actinomycetota bacterium]|nr:hypothetical protein [Actinomycetota bacterium]
MTRTKDSATAPPSTRLQRGIALHRERGHEIERISAHTYRVPSCTGEGHYTAYTDLRACTCPDHIRAKALGNGERCKHVIAAEIVLAKRRAARRRRAA